MFALNNQNLVSTEELCHFFSEFGPVMIDWPHRERMPDRPPHGTLYRLQNFYIYEI